MLRNINEGWLTRECKISLGFFFAWMRCMWNWRESTLCYENAQGMITFIGTCTGTFKNSDIQIIEHYYGAPAEQGVPLYEFIADYINNELQFKAEINSDTVSRAVDAYDERMEL